MKSGLRVFSFVIGDVKCLIQAFTFLIAIGPLFSFAQNPRQSFYSLLYLEGKAHYGFLIPHHPEIWMLTSGYFPTYEISLVKQTIGRKCSSYYRNYPMIGISYWYSELGGSEYLGQVNAVIPFIDLPLLKKEKTVLDFKVGLGVGHLSKKFDRLNNYQNQAIGSYLNAAVNFQLRLRLQMSPRTHFNAGISFLHLSNGTIKTPNYGLNIPNAFAGLSVKLNKKPVNYLVPEVLVENKGKINFRLMGSMATKQENKQWNKDFLVYVVNVLVSGYYNNSNRILFGVDGIYDESSQALIELEGDTLTRISEYGKYGLCVGHEWVFSRIAFNMCIGYYLYNPDESNSEFYDKMGLNFFITRNILIGLTLEAHYAKADFLSVGLGINL